MTKDGITIHELSKMADVTVRTIRFYTDEGVLDEPAGRDRYARYTRRHYLQLAAAKALKGMFLPLRVIRDRLASLTDGELEAIAGPVPTEHEARFTEAEHYSALELHSSSIFSPMLSEESVIAPTLRDAGVVRRYSSPPRPRDFQAPFMAAAPIDNRSAETTSMAHLNTATTTSEVWHRIVISPTMELHVREDALQDEAGEVRRILASMRKRK